MSGWRWTRSRLWSSMPNWTRVSIHFSWPYPNTVLVTSRRACCPGNGKCCPLRSIHCRRGRDGGHHRAISHIPLMGGNCHRISPFETRSIGGNCCGVQCYGRIVPFTFPLFSLGRRNCESPFNSRATTSQPWSLLAAAGLRWSRTRHSSFWVYSV